MTTKETKENNILIAEFMGLELQDDGTYYDTDVNEYIDVESLCYNENWDMLVQVVEEINAIEATNKTLLIYKSVVEFIKWYNK